MKKFLTRTDAVVLMHHPRILVETAVLQGATVEALLAGSEVWPLMLSSPDARMSYVQFGIIVDNALRLTRNPALGIDFGRRIHFSNMGMLGVACMNSANTREAFEIGIKYSRMLAPAWELTLEVEGNRAVFRARDTIALNPFRVFATEVLLFSIDTMGRSLLGPEMELNEVRLNFPRPDHADRYRELSDSPILFDQEMVEVVFDSRYLDAPIPTADPLTARLAERYCAGQLPSADSVSGLIGEVRRILYDATNRYPDSDQVARMLQTSRRTLRRGLREMGSSYQELMDEARRVHAIEYVTCTEMTSEKVAQMLNFGDVRSFRRAFKRWTGHTPAWYRKEARSGTASG